MSTAKILSDSQVIILIIIFGVIGIIYISCICWHMCREQIIEYAVTKLRPLSLILVKPINKAIDKFINKKNINHISVVPEQQNSVISDNIF